MNKLHFILRWSLYIIVFHCISSPINAQLDLSVNHADAIYNVGETAIFQATGSYTGEATYEIIYDNNVPVIQSGPINLTAGIPTSIPYTQNEPGVVICRVNFGGVIRDASVVFSPLDIGALEEEPSNFDAFWATQKNLKNSLPIDPQIAYLSENIYQTSYTFSLSNIEGRRIYGYISVPKGNGPFPASIALPPYGSSNSIVGPDLESSERGGMIAVSLSIHNAPVNQNDPNAYKPDVNSNEQEYYYRYGLIGAMHVIDYLETRPDFNGQVCAMGVSQGGGLATILAGLDDRVSLLAHSNSALGQHVGFKYDRASGFPNYLSIVNATNPGNEALFNQTVNASKYYDAIFHARRFKGAAYSLTGLKDLVVPSATALAIHKQFRGFKILMISKDGGHEHPVEYWSGRFMLARRFFEATNNPPFPYGTKSKGFFANAGNDQTVENTANLQGKIYYEEGELNNLDVSWKKISGPGEVNFSNASAYTTSANFSASGTYVLQFVGKDTRQLNEGKTYFIADEITITVNEAGDVITSTLEINCPLSQSLEIPANQDRTIVTWDAPIATSNCSGGAKTEQIAGAVSGSSFGAGIYTIRYRITDNCGNEKDCDFTITVTQAPKTESSITLNCPSDITLNAAPGENGTIVNWSEPTASTTCGEQGGDIIGDCSSTFKEGYTYMGAFENSQFYLSNNSANWSDAKVQAEQAGGHLAIISSQEENDFIQQNIENKIVYIGLSDGDQEGVFKWVDGSEVDYDKFALNLINNSDNDFVTLYPWNGDWDLNNVFVSKNYILEIPCGEGTATDNEISISQTSGGQNGSRFGVGTTKVTYIARDNCDNEEECSFNVTVNAVSSNLRLDCPSDFSVTIPAGQSSMRVFWTEASAFSDCAGGATIETTSSFKNGDEYLPGEYIIIYEAADNCGNSQTCRFTLSVFTTPTLLNLTCPEDKVFQIPAGETFTQVSWDDPISFSNCPDDIEINQISGPQNLSNLSEGTYEVIYEAKDNCENSKTCSFEITVNKTPTDLTISCPEDMVLDIQNGQNSVLIDWENPTIITNCTGPTQLTQIGGPSKQRQIGPGIYTVTFEAKNECDNTKICSFQITVNQAIPTILTVTCPEDKRYQLPQGQSEMVINWENPIVDSDCDGNITVKQISGVENSSIQGEGTYEISYEIMDLCENREVCNFTVIIEAAPVESSVLTLTCPSDIKMNIPADQSEKVVFWTEPLASTTCVTTGELVCSETSINGYSYLGEFEGSHYFKSINHFSYALATIAAENEGGYMAKITSEEENEFLRQNIGQDLCLIGLSDSESEDVWKWTDNTAASYLNFPNSINNYVSNDFVVMNFWDGGWDIIPEYIHKPYILEIPCTESGASFSNVVLTQIEGQGSGNTFGVGTTKIVYEAKDECDNVETCSFNIIIEQDPPENTDPTLAFVSTEKPQVNEDFEVTIKFTTAVTGLSGYDLEIYNANWYSFTAINSSEYRVTLDPKDPGTVSLIVPENVAFDSNLKGNTRSNKLDVDYQPFLIAMDENCLIKPSSVIIENGRTVGGAIEDLINGKGLTENDIQAEHGGESLYEGAWLNNGASTSLRFDLGTAQDIDGIALWNYSYHSWRVLKRRGVRDFEVSTSLDGVNYTVPTQFSAIQTTENGVSEKAQLFNFTSTLAQYVRITIHNALDDNFYVGLGEIRMTKNCAPVIYNTQKNTNFNSTDLIELKTNFEPKDVEIFPNPTTQNFFIKLNKGLQTNAQINIYNELGALVKTKTLQDFDNNTLEISLFSQESGVFFVHIIPENELPIIKKLVKTR